MFLNNKSDMNCLAIYFVESNQVTQNSLNTISFFLITRLLDNTVSLKNCF